MMLSSDTILCIKKLGSENYNLKLRNVGGSRWKGWGLCSAPAASGSAPAGSSTSRDSGRARGGVGRSSSDGRAGLSLAKRASRARTAADASLSSWRRLWVSLTSGLSICILKSEGL